MATKVDLPAPLRPTSARESPAGMVIETSLSARLAPKLFETPTTSATGERLPAAPPPGAMPLPLICSCRARCRPRSYFTWLPQRLLSSALAAVTIGAGRRSIGLPLSSAMRLLWSVGPCLNVSPATAASR